MLIFYFFILYTASWSTTTWDGGEGQLVWQDTTRYLYSEGLCQRRFPGELILYTPFLSEPFYIEVDSLRETRFIIKASDGRIFIVGKKENIGVIYFSDDGGYTWTESADFTNVLCVNCIAEVTEGRFIIGTTHNDNRGYMYLSEDGLEWNLEGSYMGNQILSLLERPDGYGFAGTGNSGYLYWTPFSDEWDQVSSIHLEDATKINYLYQTVSGRIYAAIKYTGNEGRLFFSDDGGTNPTGWFLMPSLFDQNVYCIAEDKDGIVYIGTGDWGGIFVINIDTVREASPTNTQRVYSIKCDLENSIYVGATSFEDGSNFGRILHTTSCGDEWDESIRIDSLRTVRSMIIANDGRLIFGGEGEYIGIFGHKESGFLISSLYDVGSDNGSSEFTFVQWQGEATNGNIDVRVRTGNSADTSTFTHWDDCSSLQSSQTLEGLPGINSGDRYVQYKLDMSTLSSATTPVFHSIEIYYNIDLIGPIIVDAQAYSSNRIDSVDIIFSECTNCPLVNGANIDEVLLLSCEHSWLSEDGFIGDIDWVSFDRLRIRLLSFGDSLPTVSIGDTVYPDSNTIRDEYENLCFEPCIICEVEGIEEKINYRFETARLEIYPNPFREKTVITLECINPIDAVTWSQHSINIYDITGRIIRTFNMSNPYEVKRQVDKFVESVSWNGFNINGDRVAPGIYFITVGDVSKKLVLLR